MALTSRISVDFSAALTGSHKLAAPSSLLRLARQIDLATGTGAGQADKVWSDRRTLAASANEDLDLAGTLLDALGTVVSFARVKALYISAATTNTNALVIGAAAANAWSALLGTTGTLTLPPAGELLVAAPGATAYPVTAGTADLLRVTNGGAGSTVTYDIAVIGASA
ncbi:hypothetical protein [Actinomadura harenae]|uniref:Uncharacterized protein n=1 Tax=Actinomadura harenae TaxID=2483351 RepID=A0A3M2LR03_9ACTN|nr:hypothetical protein [Actinomadura harenae]RMI39879.1 hypothetical protein EBO15_28340 [Actinomadura harenae]